MDQMFPSRYADAGGIRTHYLEAGSGEPVVLIHGGGAGADAHGNWRTVMPMLAEHFRVVALDMVGFGRTDKPAGNGFVYSQDARNRHLADFLDALKLGPATLIGNSMGGATAIGVAIARPDLVRRLVLMGSAGLNTKLHADLMPVINYDFTREGMVRLIRALVNDNFVIDDALVSYRYALATDPDTRRAYTAMMGWIREQGGLAYDADTLRRVKVPTLVVNGKMDKVVPLENAYTFLSLIDRSWGYIIPDCGHWAMIEHPRDFASAALNFIRAEAR
ncbi:MAG TPA: alpha/beta fold hydrolase [Alphaproteobacteria bacterium]|jgi:2-hydroxy-6-oxo-6-(2'-aminophenyl)hexa-2,4-dienoate hydrolase|nr:alpha/beta fold hydrolase [Alphaproteobacteria bacterium]